MNNWTIVGLLLCLCCCCVGPAINFYVCGYDIVGKDVKMRNVPCSMLVGGVNQVACCLALSMLAGLIRF